MNRRTPAAATAAPVSVLSVRDVAPTPVVPLAERLRRGDADAMEEVFRTCLDWIYNYCYRRTGSWSAAEDLSSAVFLEVWRSRRRVVEVDGSVVPWLYGVATNLCRNQQRAQRRSDAKRSRVALVDAYDEHTGERDPGDVAAGRLDARRSLEQVLARIAELAPADQDVFFLVCWEELSYERAAAALSIPVGTVRSRLARVRRELRLTDGLERES